MPDSKYTIFLDVQYEGMEKFLQDLGWNVETVTGIYGPTRKGRDDDNVMKYAKEHKDSIIITQDQKLAERLKNRGHKAIGFGMSDLAMRVHEILKRDYE